MAKIREYLNKNNISLSPKLYFVTAMGAMAQGLFATLLIGTIFATLGKYAHISFLTQIASYIGASSPVVGTVIGIAVAYTLKADMLAMLSCGVVGALGYVLGASSIGYTAGPAGSYVTVLIACEISKLVSKKTKVDILVTPVVTILSGFGIAKLLCPAIAYVMYYLGSFVNEATTLHPVIMGIIVSVVVGIILTLPISSAAICAMIGICGVAGGAATAGCCAQMIGFAVASYRENRIGGVVAQGLGTSMLQMGNIVKNPLIWLPPTLASAITGPLASAVFKLECGGVNAGMGTCGLVGPIGIIIDTDMTGMRIFGLVLVCFVLPAVLSLLFSEIMRKVGLIKPDDMKLDI